MTLNVAIALHVVIIPVSSTLVATRMPVSRRRSTNVWAVYLFTLDDDDDDYDDDEIAYFTMR